ncbi:MAG: hypothetical protein ACHP79_13650, partial [Terriglobales bacterium]
DGGNNQGYGNQGGGQAQQANHDQQQDDPASTCNPEVGQTVAQVEEACGKPINRTRGATKLLYFYSHPKIKVTFVNGRVADIE